MAASASPLVRRAASYFDPLLRRIGRWVRTAGYVSDVITDAAIAFVKAERARPFFAYLAFNAPHTPLQVAPEKYDKYRAGRPRRQRLPPRQGTRSPPSTMRTPPAETTGR